MYKIDNEINKREQSKLWSEEMAKKVFSEKARRTKRKLTLAGSMFMVFFLSFVIGFNVSRSEFESSSWGADYLSSVTDSIYPYVIPQDVDEFISYSFNGQ
jgi:hypothetical protein